MTYLLDKSAMAPRLGVAALERIEGEAVRGQIAVCEITRLEVLYSATTSTFQAIASELNLYRFVTTHAGCWERALDVQRLLATSSQHRLPLPDLIVAATAEQHHLTVLHNDKDFEIIAQVTGQPVERV